ncbi:hypothetical protein [Brachybacterium sp. sponge]|uniref:hypothetical protein n=1 Tax=Brachybacterium sp. sponge TaxID=1775432 RepID=UPI0007A4EF7E|nr:hypothetical protein [Brachybacterium sp. sponge]
MSATPASPAPDASADASTRIPDLPAGIGGTDPTAPLQYTAEDVAAARDLLERVRRGEATGPDGMPRPSGPPAAVQPDPPAAQDDGGRPDPSAAQEPAPVVTLSDEQIAALDGYERRQFVALPWLDAHPEQRRVAAAVALRGMIAGGQVLTRTARHEEGPRWRAVPEISGCLVLRRTAESFTTAERTVRTEAGPQVHRLHCYSHPGGVLEEETTADGLHRFTVLRAEEATVRLAAFLDPAGLADPAADAASDTGGGSVHVRGSELPAHPLAAQLAATRALTVLTRVRTADGTVQQLSAYATADGMLTMEALDPGVEDPRLEFRRVGPASLRALATVLVSGQGAPQ